MKKRGVYVNADFNISGHITLNRNESLGVKNFCKKTKPKFKLAKKASPKIFPVTKNPN
jgi:hypothetical protein